MDLGSTAWWIGLAIVAVAAVVVVRALRPRGPRDGVPTPGTPPPTDEDNYLDSSHISGPIVRPRAPGDADRR